MPIAKKYNKPPSEEETKALTPVSQEEPSWPVLDEEALTWAREQASGLPIYRVDNMGQTFVIRPLRVFEWANLLRQSTPETSDLQHEEMIAKAGVVWPILKDAFWQNGYAGQPSTLASQIRQKSGFTLIGRNGDLVGENAQVIPLSDPEVQDPEPTDEDLTSWAKTSPNQQVFKAVFPSGQTFYFRPLMRAEWVSLQAQADQDPLDAAASGCQRAVFNGPSDWGSSVAGVVDYIFDAILKVSGFSVAPQVVEL